MMSYQEVVRYLRWRAGQMRDDARKAHLLTGEASGVFATALIQAAEALEASAKAVDERAKTGSTKE